MHDVYSLGATLVVVLVGLLFNGRQIGELRKELHGVRDELRGEMRSMREELRGEMHAMRDELAQRIDGVRTELGTRIDNLQRDLTGFVREQGKQEARLEAIERGRAS